MKKSYILISLFILVIILTSAYFFLRNNPLGQKTEDQDTSIKLTSTSEEKVLQFTLKNDSRKLNFFQDKEKNKESYPWKLDYPYYIKLNKYRVNDIIYNLAKLKADRIIAENPDDLTAYGLDKPQGIVTATFTENVINNSNYLQLSIGQRSGSGIGYYTRIKGDTKVYLIKSYIINEFFQPINHFRDKNLAVIDVKNINYLKIINEDMLEIQAISENQDLLTAGIFSNYMMTEPYQYTQMVNETILNEKLETIPAQIIANEMIEDRKPDLQKYGLNPAKKQLIIGDKNNNRIHILLGHELDDTYYYAKLKNQDEIFTVEKDLYLITNSKPFELLDKLALLVNIKDVNRIKIERSVKEKYDIEIKRTQRLNVSTDKDEQNELDEKYYINSTEVVEKPFKEFYQVLIGLMYDAENPKPDKKATDIKITYYLNNADTPEVNISFTAFNRDFYAFYREGVSEFLINRRQVEKIFTEIKKLL